MLCGYVKVDPGLTGTKVVVMGSWTVIKPNWFTLSFK